MYRKQFVGNLIAGHRVDVTGEIVAQFDNLPKLMGKIRLFFLFRIAESNFLTKCNHGFFNSCPVYFSVHLLSRCFGFDVKQGNLLRQLVEDCRVFNAYYGNLIIFILPHHIYILGMIPIQLPVLIDPIFNLLLFLTHELAYFQHYSMIVLPELHHQITFIYDKHEFI